MSHYLSAMGLKEKREGIVERTLQWWDRDKRSLAWRAEPGTTPDPYRVWLSEILLQQTTARAAAPYYQSFIEKWPAVSDLAAAPIESVISVFAGLGYYSRARNLHACAKEIVRRGGRFPTEEAALRALPGVGDYTAAAIAAIAFDRPAAAIDGNVSRIVARLIGLEAPVASARKEIAAAARLLVPRDRPGDFAQALMDVGATICRPRNPVCNACPLQLDCAGFRSGAPESYPRKAAVKSKPRRSGAVFFAHRSDGAFLARRRPPNGLLASTVELPGTPWTAEEPGAGDMKWAPIVAQWRREPGVVEQVFTHFTLTLAVHVACYHGEAPDSCFWVTREGLDTVGFSNVMRKAVVHAIGTSPARRRSATKS